MQKISQNPIQSDVLQNKSEESQSKAFNGKIKKIEKIISEESQKSSIYDLKEQEEVNFIFRSIKYSEIRAGYTIVDNPPKIQIISDSRSTINYNQTSNPTKNDQDSQKKHETLIVQSRTTSNQTKNIAKNYGKAILAYILKHKVILKQICKQTSTPFQRLVEEFPDIKKRLTTMQGFRKIWTNYKYSNCMRIISKWFFQKQALHYIFNSKVTNKHTHLKYRHRFLEALRQPEKFDYMKSD